MLPGLLFLNPRVIEYTVAPPPNKTSAPIDSHISVLVFMSRRVSDTNAAGRVQRRQYGRRHCRRGVRKRNRNQRTGRTFARIYRVNGNQSHVVRLSARQGNGRKTGPRCYRLPYGPRVSAMSGTFAPDVGVKLRRWCVRNRRMHRQYPLMLV